jgi:hypothetical protein
MRADDRFQPAQGRTSTDPQQPARPEPQGAAIGSNELPAPKNNDANGLPTAPETLPSEVVAGQGFDGTWHDTPEYVIINIDGKEMKLRKSGSDQGRRAIPPPSPAEGTVRGRLLQQGTPLVNCRVVMVKMEHEGLRDEYQEPLIGMTDDQGVYRFDRVPTGQYKLTWLPAGTKHWIRRIQMKPDVVVRPGQESVVKDIRAAQRTIN